MNILLADDHALFRDGLAHWLKQLETSVNIQFAINWQSLADQVIQPFDLILIDLHMPGMKGAASVSVIHEMPNHSPILVVSANQQPDTIHACFQAGASGYICKTASGKEILVAAAEIIGGGKYIPEEYKLHNDTMSPNLSTKQLLLLSYLAKGASNKVIADSMFLSEGTIKQYVSELLRILDVDNRTQAGIKAKKILGIE